MEFQHIWGGFQLDRTDPHGRAPISSWLSTGSLPLFLIHTGNNSAGSGGNGYVTGSLLDSSNVAFEPLNVAEGQANATAGACDERDPVREFEHIEVHGTSLRWLGFTF